MAEAGTFAELWLYVERETDTLKLLEAKTLKSCLSTGKRWKFYKICLALEKKFSAEQKKVIEDWEEQNCMSDVRAAFRKFYAVAEQHSEEMKALRKATLREVCMSRAGRENKTWGAVCFSFVKHYPYETLTEKEQEKWKELEEQICVKERPWQQQFDRFIKMLENNRDELQGMQKSTLLEALEVGAYQGKPEYVLAKNFMLRICEHLDEELKAKVQEWEAMLCQGMKETPLAKFLEIVHRRQAELLSFAVASVESLFTVHAMKQDAELRFCYDFMQRVFPTVTDDEKVIVRTALEQLLPASANVPVKKAHEAKLHGKETVLGDNLPRPRMPKSLRQLYGNSADAESRTMAFFHRVNEVDTYLNELEFQDCSYCHEGWFGTKRQKAQMPGSLRP
eukprot:s3940_g1.t1